MASGTEGFEKNLGPLPGIGISFSLGSGNTIHMSDFYVGVDVGGTTTTISVGNESSEVLRLSDQFDTRSAEGPHATVQSIVDNMITNVGEAGGCISDVKSVGLATPGPATKDGVLGKPPNLRAEGWEGFPVRAELEAALQRKNPEIKVHYIGDGQAAALGEYAIRSGKVKWSEIPVAEDGSDGCSTLFMVIVGTGLGGGAVRSGHVVRGVGGRAGHVGHILLPYFAFRHNHDRELMVGNAPCTAESAVSLTSLTHQLAYRLTLDEWKDHSLNQMEGTPKDKAKQLRRLAANGDKLAMELFMDQARALGLTLLSVNYVGDYDKLIIGGGVCDLSEDVKEKYRKAAEETYRQYALKSFRTLKGFEYSICGDKAPVIGALAHLYLRSLS